MTFASKWEQLYADHLTRRQADGEIVSFSHEPITFKLAHRCTYTPDFLVVLPSGAVEIHEVKGFAREDAIVKFKVAAHANPWASFVMIRKKGKSNEWQEIMRFPAEIKPSDGTVPITAALAPKPKLIAVPQPPARMSYSTMMSMPDYAKILKMAAGDFISMRVKMKKSPSEMSALAGLPRANSWERLETGAQKLYYQRHVEALIRIMEKK